MNVPSSTHLMRAFISRTSFSIQQRVHLAGFELNGPLAAPLRGLASIARDASEGQDARCHPVPALPERPEPLRLYIDDARSSAS